MNFLVVDDSKLIHNMLNDMLSEFNITFLHAYNGREAVDAAKDSSFDAEFNFIILGNARIVGY